jgi:hypothetical protein
MKDEEPLQAIKKKNRYHYKGDLVGGFVEI